MAAVERIADVQVAAGLIVFVDARIEEPAIPGLAAKLERRAVVEIDRGDERKLALRVHDHAVVVVLEFDAVVGGQHQRLVSRASAPAAAPGNPRKSGSNPGRSV